MSSALSKINKKETKQTSKASPGQVKNNAGGFVFTVSDMDRLDRFLILGTDGGTYYVKEQDLTAQNVDFLEKLLKSNPVEVINRTVAVSVDARAPKNSQAIFLLALAMSTVEPEFKPMVTDAVQKVCRTATHLFEYAGYLEHLGGWGRAKRNSIANWYKSKTPTQVGYQAIKYRQRNGWTHADLMRLSHVKLGEEYFGVGEFIHGREFNAGNTPSIVLGFDQAQHATNVKQLISIVTEYGLPWEAVPTQFHKSPELWRALFEADQLGQTALLRNVTRLARLGMFENDMVFAREYANRLADPERIDKGRMHPIQYLNASVVYSDGTVDRRGAYSWYSYSRNKDWTTTGAISDALDEGFYAAFKNVEPANKRTLIGVDVSGSMSAAAMGLDLSCAQVAGAFSLVTNKTEPYSMVRGFSHEFVEIGITPKMKLSGVMSKMNSVNMGSTDCSLPMTWAQKNKVAVDTFVVITDNETWAGYIHPFQALKNYRQATGIDARLVVMGVAGTEFTIADPSDRGMLDVVGFDSAAPKVVADFSGGRI